METYKLRIKLGENEFEGEGAEESVRKDFEEFKILISLNTKHLPATSSDKKILDVSTPVQGISVGEKDKLLKIFQLSTDGKEMEALKTPPTDKVDAVMIVLYAYRQLLGELYVPVTRLKKVLDNAGVKIERIDRLHFSKDYISKTGKKIGSKYQILSEGMKRAKEVVEELLRKTS